MDVWTNPTINPHSLLVSGAYGMYIYKFKLLVMKQVVNTETGVLEGHIPAIIKSVSEVIKQAKNAKETPYRLGLVEVEYPDGSKAEAGAMLWEASREANPDSFKAGATIELRVQLEGEYAGNAVMGLPTLAKVDISKFTVVAKAGKKIALAGAEEDDE